jgi:diguanylate cyclase (GGDEF)-like protein
MLLRLQAAAMAWRCFVKKEIEDPTPDLTLLRSELQRERLGRLEAEAIAERGLRELYDRKEQIQLLGAIAVAANTSKSLDEVFRFALKNICENFGWPLGNSYLVQFRNGEALVEYSSTWVSHRTEAVEKFEEFTSKTVFRWNVSLPGRVLATGKLCWIEDLSKDTEFLRVKEAAAIGFHSGFAFPVIAGDDMAGVLEFFSHYITKPDPFFVDIMSHVGLELGRIVERKRTEAQLLYEATHDSLTGLPDRSLLMDRLTIAIHEQQLHPEQNFALLLMDLNRFKLINNSVGHTLGDGLLAQVAARLSDAICAAGIVARPLPGRTDNTEALCRFGGDEFALVVDRPVDEPEAEAICLMVGRALEEPFPVLERMVYLTTSIGVAISTTGSTSPAQVLRDADLAVQKAKSLGRGRHVVYEPSLGASFIDRLELETALRRALLQNEFVLHYQPIVRLITGEIIGFEALIRWNKPGVGLVMPRDFIQVAEESGLIVPIGEWVMREACKTAHRWHLEFKRERPVGIGVNLSARQFSKPDLVEAVAVLLEETGIWPGSLLFEITESVSMDDIESTILTLNRLAMLGIRATIDDFGTGYSSLSYLHRMPANVLKIDRSFVTRMHDDRDSRAIVMTILNLARDLGMDVIAEGIETETQAELLKDYECKYGQGYFFSVPLTADEASLLLASVTVVRER